MNIPEVLKKSFFDVGDTVYFIDIKIVNSGRKKAEISFVNSGIVDNVQIGSMGFGITIVTEENEWILTDKIDFFQTKAEAKLTLQQRAM